MNSEDEEGMFSPGAMMFSPNLTLNELNNMTRPCTTLCSGEEIKKPPPKRRKVLSGKKCDCVTDWPETARKEDIDKPLYHVLTAMAYILQVPLKDLTLSQVEEYVIKMEGLVEEMGPVTLLPQHLIDCCQKQRSRINKRILREREKIKVQKNEIKICGLQNENYRLTSLISFIKEVKVWPDDAQLVLDGQVAGNTDHYVKYAIQAQDNGNMTPYLQYVGLREGQTWSTLDNIENSSQHNADDL